MRGEARNMRRMVSLHIIDAVGHFSCRFLMLFVLLAKCERANWKLGWMLWVVQWCMACWRLARKKMLSRVNQAICILNTYHPVLVFFCAIIKGKFGILWIVMASIFYTFTSIVQFWKIWEQQLGDVNRPLNYLTLPLRIAVTICWNYLSFFKWENFIYRRKTWDWISCRGKKWNILYKKIQQTKHTSLLLSSDESFRHFFYFSCF
jgi:hypothetical protein